MERNTTRQWQRTSQKAKKNEVNQLREWEKRKQSRDRKRKNI
jgi:hypothetical protein